jgi:hypothetical protein
MRWLQMSSGADAGAEPLWMPQLRRVASRLGLSPGEPEGEGTSVLLIGMQGEMYDMVAMVEAFLDRIEAS